MTQTSTTPIEATGVADITSHSITYYLETLTDAAGERALTILRYLLVAALTVRYPDYTGAIRFKTRNVPTAAPDQQADVLFHDAVFYVAKCARDLDFADVASNARAGHIVYLLVPGEAELLFRQSIENHCSSLGKQVNISSIEQFITFLLYRMARFDHSEALRLLRQLLAKYNELVTLYENEPALKIVVPDFGAESGAQNWLKIT